MPFHHLPIPRLPERPCIHPISSHIERSYPVGRQNFSRAWQGKPMVLTISSEIPFNPSVLIELVTTLNVNNGAKWNSIPFQRVDDFSYECSIVPEHPGLRSFQAKFSVDGGATWASDTVPDAWVLVDPPQVDALRLYVLIPNVSGTIEDWTLDLDRIQGMGFNAIHLLPITKMDASRSPYAAKDLFALDPAYLSAKSRQEGLNQLGGYIDRAKELKIRLCFDLVLNHVGVESEMARIAPDWIVPDQDEPDRLKRAYYWSNQGWQKWRDLVLINYEHPSEAIRSEIWDYMTAYALFWAQFAHETGGFVRFDNLHSSDRDFVQAVSSKLHKQYPGLAILAEYFTDERTLLHSVPDWGLNLILATPWNEKFVPELRDYLKYLHRVSTHVRYLMPITSHDSGSPAQEFGRMESTVPRYVAAALLGTGATGMPFGVEFGESERVDFIGQKPKFDWNRAPQYAALITKVNQVLAEQAAFRCGDNCLFVDNDHHAVIGAFRMDPVDSRKGFLIVCNFDISDSQGLSVDLAPLLNSSFPLTAVDLLTGQRRSFPQAKAELYLPPCSALVLAFGLSDTSPEIT